MDYTQCSGMERTFYIIGYRKTNNWIYIYLHTYSSWKCGTFLVQISSTSGFDRCWNCLCLNWNSPALVVKTKCYSEKEPWCPHGNRTPLMGWHHKAVLIWEHLGISGILEILLKANHTYLFCVIMCTCRDVLNLATYFI